MSYIPLKGGVEKGEGGGGGWNRLRKLCVMRRVKIFNWASCSDLIVCFSGDEEGNGRRGTGKRTRPDVESYRAKV